jgi:hypothetical protein
VVINPVSGRLWKSNGRASLVHSIDDGICGLATILRCLTKASHKMKINRRSATKDIIAPIDDRTFHLVNASG